MTPEEKKFHDALHHGIVPQDPQECDNSVDAGLCLRYAIGDLGTALDHLVEAQGFGVANEIDTNPLIEVYKQLERYTEEQ